MIQPEVICEALYLINKSAKKSRDTANRSEDQGIKLRCRNRKQKLYNLKHRTIDKLVQEGYLKKAGIHAQEGKNSTFYLTYFTSTDRLPRTFSYHRPSTKEDLSEYQNGTLETMTVVPSQVVRKNLSISFQEGVQLCLKYLGITWEELGTGKQFRFQK